MRVSIKNTMSTEVDISVQVANRAVCMQQCIKQYSYQTIQLPVCMFLLSGKVHLGCIVYNKSYHVQSTMSVLTLVLLNCLFLFFIHLKLELLAQFPASNDEKHLHFMKNIHLQY